MRNVKRGACKSRTSCLRRRSIARRCFRICGFKRPEEGGYERAKADYDRFIELAKLKNCRESSIQFAENAEALDSIWEGRRGCYLGMRYRGIELGTHKKKKVYVGDVCVPISNLADSITNAERLFKRAKFPCVMCCHIADGNYHCLIPSNDDKKRVTPIGRQVS